MSSSKQEMNDYYAEKGAELIAKGLQHAGLHNVENLSAVIFAMGQRKALLDAENQKYLADHLLFLIDELLEKNITNLDNCVIPPYRVGRPTKDIKNRVFRVARLILDNELSRNMAYRQIAKDDNVSVSTVKTQYLNHEKKLISKGFKKLP